MKMFTQIIFNAITFFLLFSYSTVYATEGSITLSEEALKALQAQHKEFPKTGIKFELWQVVYRDVKQINVGAVTRVYLNRQMPNAVFTTSIGQEGTSKSINFSVTIPTDGDYVVLYYFTAVPSKFQVFKTGNKLSDGSGRVGLRYGSNVLLKKPNLKNYGLISVHPKGRAINHTATIYANTANIMPAGLFGDIIDFFEDLGEAVFEGGKTLVGVVVDATGTFLAQAYGISVALIVDGYLPDYRTITQEEYNWVNAKIFNNNLPSRDKIIITNLYGWDHRQFVFPVGNGQIMMNLGKKGFSNPRGVMLYVPNSDEKPGQIFIHEMTHVWQIHRADDIGFVAKALEAQSKGSAAYNYNRQTCDNGKQWGSFNIEQQAEIASDCFLKRENGVNNSCQESLVETHIRKGVVFPAPRTPECQNLITQIISKKAALEGRREHLEKTQGEKKLLAASESPTGKPILRFVITEQKLMADAEYRRLKSELEELNERKVAINCK